MIGPKRIRALYGILHRRPGWHRYTVIRWVVGVVFTVAVALLPWTDTMRFDFWRGRHVVLGEVVSLQEAAQAFVFPFLAINVVIVLVSRFYGRYLCGFVCPVGGLARLGEWARFEGRKGEHGLAVAATMLFVSALLAVIAFSFWVDVRVFVDGSRRAIAVAAAVLAATTGGLFVLVHVLGLRFCRDYCPSGVYFAVLGQDTTNGVELAHPESCTSCGLCDTVCPMDLAPREMAGRERRGARGLYGEEMSNHALCIRCGDCIVACEELGSRDSEDTALRMGPLAAPRGGGA